MSHTCHAIECTRQVPAKMFMCKRHWYMVPSTLRHLVWKYYRPGQEDDWQITQEYADVAKRAVIAAAEKEGLTVTGEEEELALYDFFAPDEEDSSVGSRITGISQKDQTP